MRKLAQLGAAPSRSTTTPSRGFNSRLDTIQAAVLGVKLKHLADWNRRRRQVAAWYREALAPLQDRIVLPAEAPGTVEHVYHLYVIRLRKGDRDAVLKGLNDRGVGAGIHYPIPVHLQGAYADLGLGAGSFPAAESAAKSILSLPIFAELTREQVDAVARALGEALADG